MLSFTLLGLALAFGVNFGNWNLVSSGNFGSGSTPVYQYNSVEFSGYVDTFGNIRQYDYDTSPYTFTINDNSLPQTNSLVFTCSTIRDQFSCQLWTNPNLEINYQVSFIVTISRPGGSSYYVYPIFYPVGESYDGNGYEFLNGNYYRSYMSCFDKDSSNNQIGFTIDTIVLPFVPSNTDEVYLTLIFERLPPYVVEGYLYPNYNDDMYNLAYNSGYTQGVQIGYQGGLNDGMQSGYNDGYSYGYENGYDDGERAGISSSYEEAYDNGYGSGYQVGYADGMDDAYDEGSAAAVIFNGIISIGLLPTNVFLRILNFEVFGINIGAFVSSLLTIMVLIIIFRMFFGGKTE